MTKLLKTEIKKSISKKVGQAAVVLAASSLSVSALADVMNGYIVARVSYDQGTWSIAPGTQPTLIPCTRKVERVAIKQDHSVLTGFDAGNAVVAEIHIPNPRDVISSDSAGGGDRLDAVTTDIYLPADAGIEYIQFKEQFEGATVALNINVSEVVPGLSNCEAPQFPLREAPTEVENPV